MAGCPEADNVPLNPDFQATLFSKWKVRYCFFCSIAVFLHVSVTGRQQSNEAPSSALHDACFCYEYEWTISKNELE
jgi:hypothetical protein